MTSENYQIDEEVTYCEKHPDRETSLRCNRCDRYMCAQCAMQTPVGYRCRECVRQVDDRFFSGKNQDYVILAVVSGVLGAVVTFVVMLFFGFLFILLLAGLILGPMIGELGWRAVGKRRARYARESVWMGTVIGAGGVGLLSVGLSLPLLVFVPLLAFMAGMRFQL